MREIVSLGMAHPFHVHGASFRILSLDGAPPPAHLAGWKDVVFVEDKAELLVSFNHRDVAAPLHSNRWRPCSTKKMAVTFWPWLNSTSFRASEHLSRFCSSSPSKLSKFRLAKGHSGHSLDRQAGSLPFGITILEPADEIASRAERRHRLERENAIRTAAIGDDLAVRRKRIQAIFQLAKRDIDGAGKMTERKLVFGPHIENRDKAVTQPGDQVYSRHSFQRIASMKVVRHDAVDLG